jgi:hypothetical protein
MAETLTANGFNLRQPPWCDIEDLSPLLVTAARRGDNVEVPGRHGKIRATNKRYTDALPSLPMRVLGVDPDTGLPVADPVTQLHRNLDTLLAVFHTSAVLLEHTRNDAASRSAWVELVGDPSVATRERSAPPMSRIQFDLTIWDGFWFDTDPVSQIITGTTGVTAALTAFEGATAPMADLTLTFTGPVNNPQLNLGGGTSFVKYNGVVAAGRQLVIDTASWQVSPGTGAIWAPDLRQVEFAPGPRWLELDATVAPFEVAFIHTGGGSATCSIAGRRKYLSP